MFDRGDTTARWPRQSDLEDAPRSMRLVAREAVEEPAPASGRRRVTRHPSALDEFVRTTISETLAAQTPAGSWSAEDEGGVEMLAIVVLVEAWLGALDPEDARETVSAIGSLQREDGGVGAEGSSTLLVASALSACGLHRRARPAIRVWDRVHALDALSTAQRALSERLDPTLVFAATAGVVDAGMLPRIPADLAGLPGGERLFDGTMDLREAALLLAAAGVRGRLERTTRRPSLLGAELALFARARTAQGLRALQNDDGSWDGSVVVTALSLIALEGAGLTRRDGVVARGLAWLASRRVVVRGALAVSPPRADVRDTALAVLALDACGARSEPGARAAAMRFLVRQRAMGMAPGRASVRARAFGRGGVPARAGNHTAPCVQATALSLAACAAEVDDAGSQTAVAWLASNQRSCGGFVEADAAPSTRSGDPTGTFAALLARVQTGSGWRDPKPSVEVTAQVLFALGKSGVGSEDPTAARAIRFLHRAQRSSGAVGRTRGCEATDLVASTAWALAALASVGEARHPIAARAARWLLAEQVDDGSFGGEGEAADAATGLALFALASATEAGAQSAASSLASERAALHLARSTPRGLGTLVVMLLGLGAHRRSLAVTDVRPRRAQRRA